jgi:hypothetical protein
MAQTRWIFAAMAVGALVGCGGSESSPGVDSGVVVDGGPDDLGAADTGPADTGPADAGVPDAGPADAGAPDTGPADTGPADDGATDAPVGDGAVGACQSNADCASNELGQRVCDSLTGRCVVCTGSDRSACAMGEFCGADNRCVPGCARDSDCAADGGARFCDTRRNVCVACTADAQCAPGTVCDNGTCAPGCAPEQACPSGQACCAGACLATDSNLAHCGACGNVCRTTNGTPACAMGRCGVGACAAGYGNCDGDAANGCETDTQVSATHCGACGNACQAGANATAQCSNGRCSDTCNMGFGDCDGAPSNGCETDTRTAVAHCGRCGAMCPAPANATARCAGGVCGFTCNEGFGDCDGDPGNGCETDTRTSARHCGMCNNACAAGSNAAGVCAAGRCGLRCVDGYADCDMASGNGCETSLATSAHCGRCNAACGGSTPFCAASGDAVACVSGCAAGQARCGGACVDTARDADHCGACDTVCPAAPNAARSCVGGRCGVVCNAGYGDCDGNAANGCETDLRTSTQHCGACRTACPAGANATATCAMGACGLSCATGFNNCDGNAANGCESLAASDASHCGACGRSCDGGTCQGGTCVACGVCGSGRDGAFSPSGSVTMRGGTYRFTSVTIPAGVTVRVEGTEPLRIFSTGAVRIQGTLDLRGQAGGTGAVGNSQVNNEGAPGAAGGAGGRGGYYPSSYIAGTNGQGPGGGLGAGVGGNTSAGPGGGGGGHAAMGGAGVRGTCCAARCGSDLTFAGAAGGTSYGTALVDMLRGGSGGGGGAFGGADNGGGGGGGGGGGALLVVAPSVEVSGSVLADGGNGGDAAPGYDGGAGGGGSGGTVWFRADRVIVTGTVRAEGGRGGLTTVGSTCGIGGAGGVGAPGRIRVDGRTVMGVTVPMFTAGAFACTGAPCE